MEMIYTYMVTERKKTGVLGKRKKHLEILFIHFRFREPGHGITYSKNEFKTIHQAAKQPNANVTSVCMSPPRPWPQSRPFVSPRKSVSKERKGEQLASGPLDLATRMVCPPLMTWIQCVCLSIFFFLARFRSAESARTPERNAHSNAQKPAKRACSSADKTH